MRGSESRFFTIFAIAPSFFITCTAPSIRVTESLSLPFRTSTGSFLISRNTNMKTAIGSTGSIEGKLHQVPEQHFYHSTPLHELYVPNPPPMYNPIYDGAINNEPLLLQTITRLNYCHPNTQVASVRRDPDGNDHIEEGELNKINQWDTVNVWIRSGRHSLFQPRMSLHRNGFELYQDQTICSFDRIDFLDKVDVISNYYPHCERILSNFLSTGSNEDGTRTPTIKNVTVYAFDHNVRMQVGTTTTAATKATNNVVQKPIGLVHGDYTATSAPRRLELLGQAPKINDVLRERLGSLPLLDQNTVSECIMGTDRRRYSFINVWRSIDVDGPVESYPLACMDSMSLTVNEDGKFDELRTLQIHYEDRIGENLLCCYNPKHEWYYFPGMTYDEVVFIKQWDSHGKYAKKYHIDSDESTIVTPNIPYVQPNDNELLSTFSIHTAFHDAITQPNARPRKSIEVRCVVVWD